MLYVIAIAALFLSIIYVYRFITAHLREKEHQRRKRRHDQEQVRISKAWETKRSLLHAQTTADGQVTPGNQTAG